MKIRIYSPDASAGHPVLLISSIVSDIRTGRELAWRLFIRDLSAQYRQTFLGYLWAFLPPLAASGTFIFLHSQGIVTVEGTTIPYAAFAMIGTLLWQTFVEAMQSPVISLTNAKSMLTKINFPREAILMAGLAMVTFNFLIRFALVACVMVAWQIVPGWNVALFPVAAASLILVGFSVGLLLCPLGALYGDVAKGITIVAQFWMLLTPVVYPPSTDGIARLLTAWNPVSPILITAREALTGQPLSAPSAFALVTLAAVIVSLLGLISFRVAMPHLIARMGG